MAELKERLRTDLNAAMRARDQVRMRTLRSALTAVTNEEVAGKAARELSDDEVLKVLTREAKKRREAAEAFGSAGRDEQAAAERAEGEVLAGYLPAQLSDDELTRLVAEVITADRRVRDAGHGIGHEGGQPAGGGPGRGRPGRGRGTQAADRWILIECHPPRSGNTVAGFNDVVSHGGRYRHGWKVCAQEGFHRQIPLQPAGE